MNVGLMTGIVLVFLLLGYVLRPVSGGGILMAANAFLLLASFLAVLLVLAQPLGRLMTGMVLDRALPCVAAFEQGVWRVCGVSYSEMNWRQYLCAILLFNTLGLFFWWYC